MTKRPSSISDTGFGPQPVYGAPVAVLPKTIALLGEDIPNLRPRVLVEEGASVEAGDGLLVDRKRPEIALVAPASGVVTEIRRGPRRTFDRLMMTLAEGESRKFAIPARLDRSNLTALLIEAGLWTALRTRPFDRIPAPERPPDALFVTAMDTRPLAPDPADIIRPRDGWFTAGLGALKLLTDGPTFLCQRSGTDLPHVAGVTRHDFSGPHPAGLAGSHIHALHPVGAKGMVWHIGYQDVLALGHLLERGAIWQRRFVGLAGNGFAQPALLETVPGADLHDLCRDRLVDGSIRLMSGSPIDGYQGRYLAKGHAQVTALRHNAHDGNPNILTRAIDWLTRGSGAIIPNAAHERAAPPGILPIPFLRAISVGDIETARRLGALELAEDDLALLSHADGGNADFGRMLRAVLDQLEDAP